MYSGVIMRCILGASTLESGKTAAKTVMAAVAAHREEFELQRAEPRRHAQRHRQTDRTLQRLETVRSLRDPDLDPR
jgi:hypothetical protein